MKTDSGWSGLKEHLSDIGGGGWRASLVFGKMDLPCLR
jgi:hypothetical protein